MDAVTTGWINQLLLGQAPARARPWLHARMPAFPAHAIGFGVGLAAAHSLAPSVANPTAGSSEQLAAGRVLVAAEKGLPRASPVTASGDKPPLQVFEVGRRTSRWLPNASATTTSCAGCVTRSASTRAPRWPATPTRRARPASRRSSAVTPSSSSPPSGPGSNRCADHRPGRTSGRPWPDSATASSTLP